MKLKAQTPKRLMDWNIMMTKDSEFVFLGFDIPLAFEL
jgi:hypothetical protein